MATAPATQDWAAAVLQALRAPLTKANVDFLHMWAGREGIPQGIDQNNWLGTTLPVGASHPTNSAGVQSYSSFADGVSATVRELTQSNFAPIRGALLSGNPNAYQNNPQTQSAFRTWSGGGYSWPVSSSGGGGGGILNDIGATAFYNASKHIPGVQQTVDTVNTVTGAVSSVSGFLGKITDPAYILRGLQIVAGAGLVAGGLFLLAKQVGLASSVPGPVGKVAGAVE